MVSAPTPSGGTSRKGWYRRSAGTALAVARYTEADLRRLELLTKLRRTGMPVQDMRQYAELVRQGDHTRAERLRLFRAHREPLLTRIAELQADLEVLNYKIDIYRKTVEEQE